MRKILVVGANPAWQKTLFFPRFQPGEVNRAERVESYPSGKGVNFCRAARAYGWAATRLYHFAGGETGRWLDAGLARDGQEAVSFAVAAPTRVCTTLLDGARTTELIEPSATVPPETAAAFLRRLRADLAADDAAGLAVLGTLPGETDLALYRETARAAAGCGRAFLLDAVKGAAAALDAVRDADNVFLKINREELGKMFGGADWETALRTAGARWPRAGIAVTAGAGEAALLWAGAEYRYFPARAEGAVSSLGCGDTAAAVWLAETLNGVPVPEAFARALGAASANCLTPLAGEFAPEAARALLPAWRKI